MFFMTGIVNWFNWIGDLFYQLYLECDYYGWPLNLLDNWFYTISEFVYELAWEFYYFSFWVSDVQAKISDVLSIGEIWSYFSYWFEAAEDAWYWVENAFWNVWDVVDSWWSSTQYTVLAWVDEAKSYAAALVAGLNTWLASLQSSVDDLIDSLPTIDAVITWWSNWTGNVTSVINTWWTSTLGEVQGLINSAFIIRSDFWAGWQDWRDQVTEFFTDPEDWLYKAADRIIERFW